MDAVVNLVKMYVLLLFPLLFFSRCELYRSSFLTMMQLSAVILCVMLYGGWCLDAADGNDVLDDPSAVIDALRKRLVEVSGLLRNTRPLSASGVFKLQCSCEEYCTGRCFSMMCSPCSPAAFSFPGGEELCLNVGPLGTGLLCHVDPQSGNLTESACCNADGPTCWLPQESCCSSGDCSSCPTSHYPNNLTQLYPPLQRTFSNSTCKESD